MCKLETELAALREANRWIPVGERLPDEYEDVLVVYAESVREAYMVLDSDAGPQWHGNDWVLLNVTHWRPMPAPPEPEAAPTR